MIVGGVSRERRFFNFSPITIPLGKVGGSTVSLPVPNAPWDSPGPASDVDVTKSAVQHDINPLFGAAFFFLAGALRLHPATATAGLVIGVGAAVINYGAGTASAQKPVDFGSRQPDWMKSHLVL